MNILLSLSKIVFAVSLAIFIVFIVNVVLTLNAHAIGSVGYRLDGTYDTSIVNKSRPVKMTIRRGCKNQRHLRRVANYQVKCQTKYKRRLRNTRARKSVILQNSAPRLRRVGISRVRVPGGWAIRRSTPPSAISVPYGIIRASQRRYRRETYREAAIRHHIQRARNNKANR